MDQEKPRPERAPEPKDDPRVVAHRCPFCHEAVRLDSEAWVACAQCLGRQHAACWSESGRCGACAHEKWLESPAEKTRQTRSPLPILLVVFLLGLLALGAFTGLMVARVSAPPPAPPPRVLPAPAPVVAPPAPVVAPAPKPVAVPLPRPQVERPTPRPMLSPEEQLAEKFDQELAAADVPERARLMGAAGVGLGTADPTFDWLPDRNDAATMDVARRMAREARERITEREDELANLVLEAHVQERTGDPDVAIVRCNAALDLDPRCGLAWTVRGWARLARADWRGAEMDFERGLRLSHARAWARIGLGRLDERQGYTAAAIHKYTVALGHDGGVKNASFDHDAALRARIERLEASRPRAR